MKDGTTVRIFHGKRTLESVGDAVTAVVTTCSRKGGGGILAGRPEVHVERSLQVNWGELLSKKGNEGL